MRGLAVLVLMSALPAVAAARQSPASACQSQLQRAGAGGGSEDALRACMAVFREPGCEKAWTELLDGPRSPPGYGRAPAVARMVDGCVRAYCRFPGMGRQQLCTGQTPPATTAEFYAAWRSLLGEVLHREHLPASLSDRLCRTLEAWAGFQPRAGSRTVLQAVTRPEVPGVVALTLWSAQGEQLGSWVTDVVPDESTLKALQAALPPPAAGATGTSPCIRLEAPGSLPSVTADALLKAAGEVCPADVVRLRDA
ncbi:MAG TPA: hypothetical protein VEJ89_10010 [Myxococcaceae bacterium]|nr:hypothetical protein [Myxococcaceae bacterium]